MFKNLFSKLFSTYLVITILTLVIVGVFLFNVFEEIFFESKTRELQNHANQIADMVSGYFEGEEDRRSIQDALNSIEGFLDTKVWVINSEGAIIAYTRRMALQDDFIISQADEESVLNNEKIVKREYHPSFDENMLTVAVPVNSKANASINNKADGAVFMHAPIVGFMATIGQKRQFIFYAGGIAIVCSMVSAFFLSKSISRPLFKMNKAAIEMAEGDFSQSVPVETRDEVGQLSETFNYLAGKLQKSVDELQQEKNKLESVLQGMGEGVLAVDKDKNILTANNQAYEQLKSYFSKGRLDFPILEESFEEVIKRGTILEKELKLEDNRLIFVVVSPLTLKNGAAWGSVAVLRDITEIRKLENMRREFVANVSHELRTPLTSIRGFLEALMDGIVSDKDTEKRYLNIMMDEALRLDRLINNLLDLTKIESEKFVEDFNEVDLEELVKEVSNKLNPQMKENEIIFVNEVSPGLPKVLGNRDRISQIIMNLLDNAINFSYKGGEVKVGAKYLKDQKMVKVWVVDNGKGIPKDEIEKIWQRFHKVEKSRSRGFSGEGTGLGLSIVKHLVERHGGTVDVISEYGEGSIFRFTLKVK